MTAFIDITHRKRIEKTLLALNAAAAAVRQATEPRQVYQTISDEVHKLGFSLVAFSYNGMHRKLHLEHRSFVGRLGEIWPYVEPMSPETDVVVALADIPEFIRVLETGQAEFVAAPAETVSMAITRHYGVPQHYVEQALGPQRAVLAPVVNQQQVTGVFLILGEDLSEDDLPAFEAFANQASVALDNARLLAAERRERQRAETLGKVASILNSTSNLDDALREVMQQLRAILPFDNCALFLTSDGMMECRVAIGDLAPRWEDVRLKIERFPLLHEMLTTLQSVLVSDTRQESRWVDSSAFRLASWMGVPLVANGQLLGMLSVDQSEYGFFTVEHQEVMTAFADQLSVAVQRARHFNDAQQRVRELASLAQVSASLAEAPDLEAVLDVVLGSACDLLASNRGGIALTSGQGEQLRVVAERGHAPVLVDPAAPVQPQDQTTSTALILGGQVIGLIEVEQSALDPARRRLLTAIADLAAVAIDKAQLYQDTVRAYEELRDLDRLKDEFVQNVSHELRTPLTFVKGYVEYLLEGYAGDLSQGQRQALEIVLDRSNAIIRLVNDIVSLKQAELHELDLQPLALELIAIACVEGSRVAAEQAGIRMQLAIAPDLPKVHGDSKRLGQVFDNLLGNAIKFSPDGGEISVRLSHLGHQVQVDVRDMGIGMPPDRLDQIWDRFYQLDSASTRRFPGAGLGLAIVKRIIDAHDGRIWVESELNVGSTFSFLLPVYDETDDV